MLQWGLSWAWGRIVSRERLYGVVPASFAILPKEQVLVYILWSELAFAMGLFSKSAD